MIVTTSADTSATPSHPIPTSGNNKTTPSVPVGKQVTPGAQKKAPDKNKTKPSSKEKKNPTKPATTTRLLQSYVVSQRIEQNTQLL